jgi:hypothetical protein
MPPPKRTYSRKGPARKNATTAASNQSTLKATTPPPLHYARMSTGHPIHPIPRKHDRALVPTSPDLTLNNNPFWLGHRRANTTPQRPRNHIAELATTQLDPSTPAGGSPGRSPSIQIESHTKSLPESSPASTPLARAKNTITAHLSPLPNSPLRAPSLTAADEAMLSTPRRGSSLDTPRRAPTLDALDKTALNLPCRAPSLDAIDEMLVLRMDRELWPIIEAGNNTREKEKVNTPGRFFVCPEWGEDYIALLELYLDIKHGAPKGSLPAARLPVELKEWKKRQRVCSLCDKITVAGRRLPQELQAWWVSLQPAERVLPDRSLSPGVAGGMDWTPLMVGGGNGLVTVVAGLAMWREGLDKGVWAGNLTQWETLVNDMRSVFAAIVLTVPKTPPSPPCTQPTTAVRKRKGLLLSSLVSKKKKV